MNGRQLSLVVAVLLVFGLVVGSVYTVGEWEKVVVIRFGEVIATNCPPGLHLKLPAADRVRRYDARIQTLDSSEGRLLTKDGQNLVMDFFVKWRITDVGSYYRASGGDDTKISAQILSVVQDSLAKEFAGYSPEQAIAGVTRERMNILVADADARFKKLGLAIIDVRLKAIDLPDEMTQSAYGRMQAERRAKVEEVRARGDADAAGIRAEAERQREVTLADGYRQAEEIRGDGDAQAAATYANAYGRDAEFYSFYRSLAVYQNSLHDKGDILLLQPDGELFKYFNPPAGK